MKEVLDGLRLPNRPHEVFPVGSRSIVVDFFLPKQNLVIECWRSVSRRGVALTWAESKAAYIDLKFRRLKVCYPGIKCFALVEVIQVDLASLHEVIGAVMVHADWMAFTMEELVTTVREWCRVGG